MPPRTLQQFLSLPDWDHGLMKTSTPAAAAPAGGQPIGRLDFSIRSRRLRRNRRRPHAPAPANPNSASSGRLPGDPATARTSTCAPLPPESGCVGKSCTQSCGGKGRHDEFPTAQKSGTRIVAQRLARSHATRFGRGGINPGAEYGWWTNPCAVPALRTAMTNARNIKQSAGAEQTIPQAVRNQATLATASPRSVPPPGFARIGGHQRGLPHGSVGPCPRCGGQSPNRR